MKVTQSDWDIYRREANKNEPDENEETHAFVGDPRQIPREYIESLKAEAKEQGARVVVKEDAVFVLFAKAEAPTMKLCIEITGKDDGDLDLALEEVTKMVGRGFTSGTNKNETGSYRFRITEE